MVEDCNCGKTTIEEMISMIDDETKPFIETIISDNEVIREFLPGQPDHLYKWHLDPENRLVQVLEDSDWKFQYDNQLPIPLLTTINIVIPASVIHRLIPGTTKLNLKIIKNYEII